MRHGETHRFGRPARLSKRPTWFERGLSRIPPGLHHTIRWRRTARLPCHGSRTRHPVRNARSVPRDGHRSRTVASEWLHRYGEPIRTVASSESRNGKAVQRPTARAGRLPRIGVRSTRGRSYLDPLLCVPSIRLRPRRELRRIRYDYVCAPDRRHSSVRGIPSKRQARVSRSRANWLKIRFGLGSAMDWPLSSGPVTTAFDGNGRYRGEVSTLSQAIRSRRS